ncbi:unnamed protein product [Cunninghamella echinulata]
MVAHNIPNTTFTWCPTTPIIATGSTIERSSYLELFRLNTDNSGTIQNSIGKVHSPSSTSLGESQTTRPLGIIAAGTQTGILEIWDPYIIANQDKCNINYAFLSQHPSAHTRSIFHMEFNIHQANLLVTAGNDNEILIWDLINSPEKPYTPGAHTMTYNENLTDVAWNSQVPYILATSFSSGRTGILDLRTKKEVMNLSSNSYLSSITWHPDNATQIATGSTDDNHPVVMLWDLRKAQTYEKAFQEHTKGVVDLSWCRQDSELLVSASRDGRILSWNPQTGNLVDTISDTDPWPYQIDFCPRNPNWLASSSINGEINVWSIQNDHKTPTIYKPHIITEEQQNLSRQPPKWLKRPIGATFGFGGKLILFNSTSQSAVNVNQFKNTRPNENVTPKIRIVTLSDKDISQRSSTLEYAKIDHQMLLDFVDKQSQLYSADNTNHWHLLKILFAENAREQLIHHMGLNKEEINLPNFTVNTVTTSPPLLQHQQQQSTFENNMNHLHHQQQLQNNNNNNNNNTIDQAPTLSGIFRSVDMQLPKPANDFFASADIINTNNHNIISTAPVESATRDKKITQAVAVGNFDLAVSLCLEDETRMSDALLLAISGGPDLFASTRRLYLEKRTKVPYMQLLDNIVRQDLMSFVQNSHVDDWKLVLATLCTFAPSDEFSVLCETLGNRLETAATSLLEKNISLMNLPDPHQLIHQAVICYLAAGKLERVLPIWVSEVNNNGHYHHAQQQQQQQNNSNNNNKSYTSRLQEFIEKVTIFLSAIGSTDSIIRENETDDGITGATSGLSLKDNNWMDLLYEKYCEYAEFLAANGLLDTAFKYLSLIPDSFGQRCNHRMSVIHHRIYRASDQRSAIVLQKEPMFPYEPHHQIVVKDIFPPQYRLQYQNQPPQQPQHQQYHPYPNQQQQSPSPLPLQQREQREHQLYNQQYHILQQQQNPHHLNHQPSLDVLKTRENFYTTPNEDNHTIDTRKLDEALFMTARDIPFFDDTNNVPHEYQQRYNNNKTFFDSFTLGIQSKVEIQQDNMDKQSQSHTDDQSYQDTTPLTFASESYINNDMDNTGYFDEKKHQHYAHLPNTPPAGPPTAQQVRGLGIKQKPSVPQQQQQQQQTSYYQQQQQQHMNDSSRESSLQTSPSQLPQNNIYQQQRYHQNTITSPQQQNSYDETTSTTYLPSNESNLTNNNDQKGEEISPIFQRSSPRFQTNKTQKSSPREQFQEKRRYSKGDRSNIKAEHLPIYHILYYSVPHSRQKLEGSQKKFWDDVDKRLGYLFDQLNNHEVSESVIQSLLELVDAYDNGRYEEAQNIQMNLVTTKYDECSSWLLALKRIIENAKEKKESNISRA